MPRLIVFLLISSVGGMIGGWMWSKLSKSYNGYPSKIIGVILACCILWGLNGLQFNSEMLAQITIETPTQVEIQKDQVQIQGTVSPADSQVYILVHPENGNLWWVQPSPIISGDGTLSGMANWNATINLGNGQEGKKVKFDVLALASTNSLMVDFLSGVYLSVGDTIKDIPLLSRSNIIVFTRE